MSTREYVYTNSEATWSNHYLWPILTRIITALDHRDKRVFEIGCGNGATSGMLGTMGYRATGIDTSASGIEMARKAYPEAVFARASVYDDLASQYGTFPLVLSLEVIEHCFSPVEFAATVFDLLEPKGVALISTPYHSYWKNLALAASGKMDAHFTALWEGGHIKFFSEKTMSALFMHAGFSTISFYRVGRVPIFAKSLLAVITK